MQKTLIIVLAVIVVALVGVVVFQKLDQPEATPIVVNQPIVSEPTVNQPATNEPANNQPSTNCAKEGEEQIATAALYKSCCSGLTSVSKASDYDTNCNLTPDAKIANRLNSVCTACGNGVCGTSENQCNCPTDCKASETGGLKTYTNQQYSFEVKYPKEWTVEEYETGLITFSAPDQGQAWISRDKDKKYQDINDYLSQWEYKDPNQAALWNVNQGNFVKINGINFYKYTWAHQAQGETYLTIENGDLVNITFRSDDATRPLNNFTSYPKFLGMLSTFKFTK